MNRNIVFIVILLLSVFGGLLALCFHSGIGTPPDRMDYYDPFEDMQPLESIEEPSIYLSWDELIWTGPDASDSYLMDVSTELLSDYDGYPKLDYWTFNRETLNLFDPLYSMNLRHRKSLSPDIPKRRFFNNIISYTGRQNDLLLSMYSRFRKTIFKVLSTERFYDLQIQNLLRILNESYSYYYQNGYMDTEELQVAYEVLSAGEDDSWINDQVIRMSEEYGVAVFDEDGVYNHEFYERFWAYSFWARRHAESNIPAVKAILDDLWAHYVEEREIVLEEDVLDNVTPFIDENGDYKYDCYMDGKLIFTYYYNMHGQRTGNWTQYDYSGEKIRECRMENDMLHGQYKEYSDGKLESCYQFIDDVLISGVFYDSEGNSKQSVRYEFIDGQLKEFIDKGNEGTIERQQINGITEGLYIVKYPDGGLEIEANYLQGKRNGEYKKYYPSGQLQEYSNYKNGVLDGLSITYAEDGKPKVEANYVKNHRNGDYKEYYPSGQLKLHYIYDMHKPDGINRYYYKNGKVRTESKWSAGKGYADEVKEYHSTGRLVSITTSVNGGVEFLCKTFDEKGNLHSELTKVNDKKHGACKMYFPSGALKKEAVFNNDKPEGIYQTFYEDGKPEWVLPYEMGERHGECILYYPSGTIAKSFHMVNGKKTGIETFFYESGEKKSEVVWLDGKREGIFRQYYPSGILQEEGHYSNDKPDGEFITYKKNGKINKRMTYKDGILL